MHISISTTQLLSTLQHVSRFVSTKSHLPILSSVAIETQNDGILCTATDLQVGIRERVLANVTEAGRCVVPAKMLIEVISSLEDDSVDIIVDELALTVKTNSLQAKITCFPFEDYPPFPEKEGSVYTLPLRFLVEGSNTVLFAASNDETRPILTSALLSFGEESRLVTTDGFRLAIFSASTPSTKEVSFLLPAKSLQEVVRMLGTLEVDTTQIQLSEGLKQVFFSVGSAEIVMRILEGDFPPYQRILPESFALEVVVSRQKLEKLIKTAMVFSRDSSGIVKLEMRGDSMTVSARSSTQGEYAAELSLQRVTGGENHIACNGRYILDLLSRLKDEEVRFQMNDPLKPCMISAVTTSELQYVVMPFRLSE